MARLLRVLTFSTLYPNAQVPVHGVFVEKRLLEMLKCCEFECEVIAPVPWFPFKWAGFGKYSVMARIGRTETRNGLDVSHPRYPLLPKIGMTMAPFTMALACLPLLKARMSDGFDFDVIDAHYYYPDGVAATILGTMVQKPVVVTARGTDLNFIPRYRLPRMLLQWAIRRVNHNITVCEALRTTLLDLGAAPENVTTLRNGVDTGLFSPPEDRAKLRASLNIACPMLLSVGHLIDRKGHDLVIRALTDLPGVRLIIAGEGEERGSLTALIERLGLTDRVTMVGAVDQERLCSLYGAADVVVLASSREGWANVLLESMACGTPVAATAVGGTPEVISRPEAGVLVSRDVGSIVKGVKEILSSPYDRSAVRRHAELHSWEPTVNAAYQILTKVARCQKE